MSKLITIAHQAGQRIQASFDKEMLKQLPKVSSHPQLSNEANWGMVSLVYKHNSSSKRIVLSFKGNYSEIASAKVKSGMNAGDQYELKKIIISGTNRVPMISVDRFEISNPSELDLVLGSGGEVEPPPAIATVTLSSDWNNSDLYAILTNVGTEQNPIYTAPATPEAVVSVTATFSKSVSGFALGDINVTNGVASNLSGSGSSYTFDVTPSERGSVSISIPSNVVTGGNSSSNSISLNYWAPFETTLSTSASSTVYGSFSVTLTSSISARNFTVEDLNLTNATASNFSVVFSDYFTSATFDVTGTNDGEVGVQLNGWRIFDEIGSQNFPSNTITRQYYAPVTATLSSASSSNVTGAFSVTATFSKSVSGFALGDINVTNGVASNLSGSGSSYTFDVTPSADGEVSVSVGADSATGSNGEQNLASNSLSRTYSAGYRYYKFSGKDGWNQPGNPTTILQIAISEFGMKWDGEIKNLSSYPITFYKTPTVAGSDSMVNGSTGSSSSYTYWTNTSLNGSMTDLFRIDLGVSRNVTQIFLAPRDIGSGTWGQAPKTFKIFGSNDNSNWTEVLDVAETTHTGWNTYATGLRPFNLGSNIANENMLISSAGSWNSSAIWSSGLVPNSNDANIAFYRGNATTVTLNQNATINKLEAFTGAHSTTINASGSNTLTFDGLNSQLFQACGTVNIYSPVSINSAFKLKSAYGTGVNTNFYGIVGGSGTFNYESTAQLSFLSASANTLSGTINHKGKHLRIDSPSIGTASIVWSNTVADTTIQFNNISSSISFPITFDDISGNTYVLHGGNKQFTGSLSGNIKNPLKLRGGNYNTANLSGLSFSGNGNITVTAEGISIYPRLTNLPASAEIVLGDGSASTLTALGISGTFANKITTKHQSSLISGNLSHIILPQNNTNISGNIVLDPDGVAANGTQVSIWTGGSSNSLTISGVMSNGSVNNRSNISVRFQYSSNGSGTVKLTNANTYTSPTLIEGGTYLYVVGLNGSMTSPVTVNNNAIFGGSGTLNANISVGSSSGTLSSYVPGGSAAVAVDGFLTINGDLTVRNDAGVSYLHNVYAAGNKASKVVVNGNITLNKNLQLGYMPAVSGTYCVLEYTGTLSGTGTFVKDPQASYSTHYMTVDTVNKKVYVTKP